MTTRTKIADKVRKLLRLSKRGGTEAEARLAAEQAARLVTKHGLSWTEVQDDEQDDQEAIDTDNWTQIFARRGERASLTSWEKALGSDLGQLCGCFVFHSRQRGHEPSVGLRAVGRTRDLQILAVLYPALRGTVAKLVRQKAAVFRARRLRFSPVSYGTGLVWELTRRMRAEQNAVLDEIRRGAQEALVHVDTPAERARRAREAFEQTHRLGAARQLSRPDLRSAAQGMQDGRDLALPGQHEALTGQLALPAKRS